MVFLYVLDKNSGNIRNIKFDNRKKFLYQKQYQLKYLILKTAKNTIYQTLDNFPDLEQLDKWTMSIDFNWDGTGNWQSIIGSMYSNNLVNNRGWGSGYLIHQDNYTGVEDHHLRANT